MVVPADSPFEQLDQSGGSGAGHDHHHPLAVPAARHSQGRDPESLSGYAGLPDDSRPVFRRLGSDTAGDVAEAQTRRPPRRPSAGIPDPHLEQSGLRRLVYFIGATTVVNVVIGSQLAY